MNGMKIRRYCLFFSPLLLNIFKVLPSVNPYVKPLLYWYQKVPSETATAKIFKAIAFCSVM